EESHPHRDGDRDDRPDPALKRQAVHGRRRRLCDLDLLQHPADLFPRSGALRPMRADVLWKQGHPHTPCCMMRMRRAAVLLYPRFSFVVPADAGTTTDPVLSI